MTDTPAGYVDELEANREEKDQFFDEHPQSPIPPEERDEFDGLDYFDPAPAYRVTATVSTVDPPDPVEMETSDGRTVRYLRVVTFAFDLEGEDYELAGYRQPEDDSGGVFVPFRDKTTGQQAYPGGRYMELEPDGDLADGDEITLDFNLAYNPFCAFSETFSCPLPPEANWLETAVEAGEKKY
jgi:uncharacterized protein (DUF1684 family)